MIVTSSSDDPLYPDRALRTGACGFVAKHDLSGAALQRLLDAGRAAGVGRGAPGTPRRRPGSGSCRAR